MTWRALLWLGALWAALPEARAVDPRQRSDSSSGQFTIYCEDVRLRLRVVSFAEEVKSDVLRLLSETTKANQAPIVITLEPATTESLNDAPARLRLVDTPQGFKVEIGVRIGADAAAVNLQRYLVRALLLEYAYRERGVKGGMAFTEAPWWLIEGVLQISRRRDFGLNRDLFQRLTETNKLPPIGHFLAHDPEGLGATAQAVDQALAMALVQMLVDQPNGGDRLAHLLRAWPEGSGDPLALLKKDFPDVAPDEPTLQKWWTITLARFAVSERFQGLTAAETEAALAPLLELDVPVGDGKRKFPVADFREYLKLDASRTVLKERHAAVIALSARAHVLFGPLLAEYEQAFASLARGKTAGLRERLASIAVLREATLRRSDEIADYLNWFEATQMPSSSGAFDSYLRTANEISEQDRKHTDPIARYLDTLEQEF